LGAGFWGFYLEVWHTSLVFIREGRRKKEEGRRKKEEGRRKKEEGRRKKEDTIKLMVWAIHNVLTVEVAILRFCLN
jgi:hypothetical protein